MSGGNLENIIINDFNRHIDDIKEILRDYRENNPQVIDYILALDRVETIEQAEIIHLARDLIREEDPPTPDEVRESGRYRLLPESQSKYHRDESDEANRFNQKWVSEDGRHEYIIRPVIDPVTGQVSFEFVEDIRYKGTPNYGGDPCSSDHVVLDMNPYYCWGNGSNDPDDRSAAERQGVIEQVLVAVTAGDDWPWWYGNARPVIGQFRTDALCAAKDLIGGLTDTDGNLPERLRERFREAEVTRSPLVVDLDGDGIETLGRGDGIHFDHDGNGFAESTGWAAPDDGLIVIDHDGDGRIMSGAELFGSHYSIDDTESYANGFVALASQDSNGDGFVDSADASYADIRVWKDGDSDGEVDEGELLTLTQAGISRLDVSYVEPSNPAPDAGGNLHLQVGSFVDTAGNTREMHDVWFETDTAVSAEVVQPELSIAILALPDVEGFGNVAGLRNAMAADGSGRLEQAVRNYVAANESQRDARLLEVLYRWAGVHNIAPDDRAATQIYGNAIGDARKLAVLEKFLGYSYLGIWCWGERDPNPHGPAAEILLEAFDTLAAHVDGQLAMQTRFADLMQLMRFTWSPETGRVALDVSETVAELITRIGTDVETGTLLLLDYASALGTLGSGGQHIMELIRAQGDASGTSAMQLIAGFGLLDTVGTAAADRITGGDGNDVVLGLEGNDNLNGGDGDDTIVGGPGDDYLRGGEGRDLYRFELGDGQDTINNADSDGSTDRIVLGAGITPDMVILSRDYFDLKLIIGGDGDEIEIASYLDQAGTTPFAVDLIVFADGTRWTPAMVMQRLNVATEDGDFIQGDDRNNRFLALGGNDDVSGFGGNDTLDGGAGNDRLYGGADNDRISGGEGRDYIYGGTGNDRLEGGTDNDFLKGEAGSDIYVLAPGAGVDRIDNSADDGADARDQIVFTGGIDPGDVSVRRRYNDLELQFGQDSVRVSNHFRGEDTAIDRIAFAGRGFWDQAEILRRSQLGTADADFLSGVEAAERLSGLAGRDTIEGGGGDDTLDGGADADRIDGGAGNDSITGGDGDDYLRGGAGSDTYRFERGFGSDVISNYLYGADPDKVDRIAFTGGISPQDVTASRRYDDLVLSVGADTVTVQAHFRNPASAIQAVIFAGAQNWDSDEILRRTQIGTADRDLLVGTAIDDTLSGLAGRDTIRGGGGDDTLRGGEDDDNITGDDGDDLIIGDGGNDQLSGGAGSDTYSFGVGFGMDRISNYAAAYLDDTDKIDRILFSGISPNDVALRRVGDNLVVTVGDDRIDVYSNFRSDAYGIQRIQFAGSGYWDADEILQRTRIGSADADLLIGSDAADRLSGLAGRDTIRGGDGNDSLSGGDDADRIEGGDGNDRLDGGSDDDYLAGGAGNDTYRFSAGSGVDRIWNYVARSSDDKVDRIVFDGSVAPGAVGVSRNYDDLILSFGEDRISVQSHFRSADYGIQQIVFAGVGIWNSAEILRRSQLGTPENDLLIGSSIDDRLSGLGGRDSLRGGDGDDTLSGGDGNDSVSGEAGNDDLTGGAGNDYLTGGAGSDTYRFAPGFGEDRIYNYASTYGDSEDKFDRIVFSGIAPGELALSRNRDDLILSHGSDRIQVQSHFSGPQYGIQQIAFAGSGTWDAARILRLTQAGTAGPDLLVGSDIDDTLSGLGGRDTIRGGEGNDTLSGGADGDSIQGERGNDILTGGTGDDYLSGGSGSDTYRFESGHGTDRIYNYAPAYLDPEGAVDTVAYRDIAPGSVTVRRIGTDLELTTGQDSIRVQGHFANDAYAISRIVFAGGETWNAGEILRRSQGGTDQNDLLVGDDAMDVFAGFGGNDTLRGNGGDDRLNGGDGADSLDGGAGDDHLEGGSGDDYLVGGTGSDVYRFTPGFGTDRIYNYASPYLDVEAKVDTVHFVGIRPGQVSVGRMSNDLILEAAEDSVRVQSHFSGGGYAVQRVTFANGTVWDAAAILAFSQIGNGGDNNLVGSEIDDTLSGFAGQDTLVGAGGNDRLFGGPDDDRLDGGNDDDLLDGGAGGDYMVGGWGNDHYRVDDPRDRVIERYNGGTDRVSSSLSQDLSQLRYVEDVTLVGNAAINATGNNFDNAIDGNGAANLLSGLAGDDTINGRAGDDTLDGGEGADLLIGGPGSDRIVVDNAADRVGESRSWAGIDTVVASIDFRMGNRHIENLELTDTARLGAGNGLTNRITGNDGDNILDGGKNNDTLIGGAGDDRYLVRSPGDRTIEQVGGGIDEVLAYRSHALEAHVEKLFMQTVYTRDGDPTIFNGIGNGLDNTIIGTPFANFVIGREGRDTLKGQAGADTFVFDRAIGNDNVDRIIDFNVNEANEGDRLFMKGSVFGGLTAGSLNAALFHLGTSAGDGNDRFIFDQSGGRLWFDADGTGSSAQQLIATFEQNAQILAADIEVF